MKQEILRWALAGWICLGATACTTLELSAGDCPPKRDPRISAPEVPLNIDKVKRQLREYKAGNYLQDVAAVAGDALTYLKTRAGKVRNPALILDIDETALFNWPVIDADDFGFIKDGPCNDPAKRGACGFDAWIDRAEAQAIEPTLSLYKAARELGVTVFFVTGRPETSRKVTAANLVRAGYEGVEQKRLRMRSEAEAKLPAAEYKTGARKEISQNFTILANMGDQESDLSGKFAECTFKVPNPFYFIP